MDSEKVAFWGIALKPGEPADLELQDGETLHVTNASLGEDLVDDKGRSVVTATIKQSADDDDDDDDDKSAEAKKTEEVVKKYAVTSLNAGRNESCVLDVSFIGDENVTFEVTGKNTVHLVGSFSFDHISDDSDDSDDGELIGEYDDEDDDDEDESMDDDDSKSKRPPPLMLDPPTITELEDSGDDQGSVVVEEPVSKKTPVKKKDDKKAKLPNGKGPTPVKKSTSQPDKKVGKGNAEKKSVATPAESNAASKSAAGEGKESTPSIKSKKKATPEKVSADSGKEVTTVADVPMKEAESTPDEPKVVVEEETIEEVTTEVIPQPESSATVSPQATINSNKKRVSRKRKVSVEANPSTNTSTPSSAVKKSKVSDRQSTPAAVKTASKSGSAKVGKTESLASGSSPAGKNSKVNGVDTVKEDVAMDDKQAASTPSGSLKKKKKKTKKKVSTGGS